MAPEEATTLLPSGALTGLEWQKKPILDRILLLQAVS